MGGEKGSKGGRYVGGFLQLFDWNAKSRKKLFSSKSDLPEQSKQGKRSEENLPMTRVRVVDEDEFGARLSFKNSGDYSCASSMTDDEGYGVKAPGVIARLMGLDSLPTSNVVEPYYVPFSDVQSLQDTPFRGRNLSENLLDKVEGPDRTELDARIQKVLNRPIEKFRTEILPPKSAKSIPITHHKLLSPIKSPIFVPSKDAADIMEAAAKIIEPGPHVSMRTKISPSGSSSAPLKVRELKEKLDGAQRPSGIVEPSQRRTEFNAAQYLRGQCMNKSWNGPVDATSFKASPSTDDSSSTSRSKGKSISLAIQAKVNVQRREGLNPSNRSVGVGGLEEQSEIRSTQSIKGQSNSHKVTCKKSSVGSTSPVLRQNSNASSVLRQNNQKQNCATYKDKPASKSVVTSGSRKVAQKSFTKDGGTLRTSSRKSTLQEREGEKEVAYFGARNNPRKKRSIDSNLQFEKNDNADNMLTSKIGKLSQSNMAVDRQFTLSEESKRKGMDVVSFTFTAPMTRSMPGLDPSGQVADNRSKKALVNCDASRLSSLGYNVIGGDALSVLLEQKLKEYTFGLESSHSNFMEGTSMASSIQRNVVNNSQESATGRSENRKAIRGLGMHSQMFMDYSAEPTTSKRKCVFQEGEDMGEYSSNAVGTEHWYDGRFPSPVSILKPSILTESCNSSDSVESYITEESKQCSSSVQAQGLLYSTSSMKLQPMEIDTDLSDSASSSSLNHENDDTWELEYVKDILSNIQLMYMDYASGRTREIVNPHLFDQLERRKVSLQTRPDEFRLKRKALFDCVSECLDLKYQRFVGGSHKMWEKGMAMVKRKERVAEELYKEIQGWRSMSNSMVDELVDKDMSSQYGRWVDFEVDEFAVGVEIEREIFDSLVLEVVGDILPFECSYLEVLAYAM